MSAFHTEFFDLRLGQMLNPYECVQALTRFRAEVGAKSFPGSAECAGAPLTEVEAFRARLADDAG